MTLTTVYKKPILVKYRTPSCSMAMIFHILSIIIIMVVPGLVGYYTRNFWVTDMSYKVQPNVAFKYKLITFLKDKDNKERLWSTFSTLNTLAQDMVSVPSVGVIEHDTNRDGRVDKFNITLQFQLTNIVSVQTLLIFQYELNTFCKLVMETPLYIAKSIDGGGKVVVFGDMNLKQDISLQPHNQNTMYNGSLITDINLIESYDIPKILTTVAGRSLTTTFTELYTATETSSTFVASFIVNIPSQYIRYEPGFWEAVKYAWIQYLALLLVVYHVMTRVRGFVFENMIVTTIRLDRQKSE